MKSAKNVNISGYAGAVVKGIGNLMPGRGGMKIIFAGRIRYFLIYGMIKLQRSLLKGGAGGGFEDEKFPADVVFEDGFLYDNVYDNRMLLYCARWEKIIKMKYCSDFWRSVRDAEENDDRKSRNRSAEF